MQKLLDHLSELWVIAHPSHRDPYTSSHRWLLLAIFLLAAFLRFWGLGSIGLHGDEETMALAVRHILDEGTSHLPSGMFYPRGLAQLYLMATSVSLFGETEWALRLPSVLCGLLVILFAFLAGRRFLHPQWNIAFTAAVAFLPGLIVLSQTARMYIFLVACVAALMWLTFTWERTGKPRFLVLAVFVILLGIHFQSLMIFSALILLFPPLVRDDLRELKQAAVALVIVAVGFFLIDGWVEQQYSDLVPLEGTETHLVAWQGILGGMYSHHLVMFTLGVAAATAIATFISRRLPATPVRWGSAGLIVVGFIAQLVLFYHVACVLLLAGVILALRNGRNLAAPIAALVTAAGGLLLAHMVALYRSGVESPSEMAGALTGLPSLWPFIQTTDFSHLGFAIASIGFLFALWDLAHRRRICDYWVLFVLGCLIPLMVIGTVRWNVPPRYTVGAVLPYLLCAFALLQTWVASLKTVRSIEFNRFAPPLIAAIACVLIVNPITLARSVNPGYSTHPDHKGAAEFLRSLNLTVKDVVLAEDVLQQTYYLGSVNYWLISWNTARHYIRRSDPLLRDIYTGTPLLKSAEELEALLKKTPGQVYIIGSGENRADGRRAMRSDGLFEFLQSDRVESLYTGRDNFTQVWRVKKKPALTVSQSTQS